MTKSNGNPKFEIRVAPSRRKTWERAAEIEQRTLSDFIKVAIDERAERTQALWQATIERHQILTSIKMEHILQDNNVIEEPMTFKDIQDHVLDLLWQANKSANLTREQFKKGESK